MLLAENLWDIGTISVVAVFAVGAVGTIGGICYAIAKNRSDNNLKRHMIDSGMSPEEIERVMAAGANEEEEE